MKKVFFLLFLVLILAACKPPKLAKKLPPMFLIGHTMETGLEPSFIISEDFDMDGNLDLIATNSGDHTFSYYKGIGDGTFKDQIVFNTGKDPICVAAGLFNADAFLDLAVLNYADQTVRIFLNTKSGSFRDTGVFLHPGKIPINLAAADFNHDGMDDLVVTMRYHKVEVMLAKGNGKFTDPVGIAVKGQPTGLVTGDYNHDKKTDVAVALAGSGNTGVQILWGKDDGTFEPSELFKGGGQPLTIVNIDANGDGLVDFVTSSNVLHAMTAILNKGDKSFEALRDFASGTFPKFVAAADFTGDGLTDIAVSNSTDDAITVSVGNGDGTFTYPPIYHRVDEYPQGMVVGDFNKDGLIDIAVTCRDKRIIDILLKKNMVNPKPHYPDKEKKTA